MAVCMYVNMCACLYVCVSAWHNVKLPGLLVVWQYDWLYGYLAECMCVWQYCCLAVYLYL